MSFELILETAIGDPADRETLAKLAERHPALRDSMLRQEDYSSKMGALNARVKVADDWDKWRVGNWDEQTGKPKSQIVVEQSLAERERELADLKLNGGGEVNFDEILAELPKRGVVTNQTFNEQILPSLDKDVRAMFNQQEDRFARDLADGGSLLMRHRDELGENLNLASVIEHRKKTGKGTLAEAYDDLYGDRYRQKREADAAAKQAEVDKRIQEAEERGKKAGRQEAVSTSGRMSPTDETGGTAEMGALQLRKQRIAKGTPEGEADLSKSPLGSGVAAQEGLDEWRAGKYKQAGQ